MTGRAPGVRIPDLVPGSASWWQEITASKVPAILNHNPAGYENRFSTWHKMRGQVEADPATDQMRRGHFLERGCLEWFLAEHPKILPLDYPGGTWRNSERPWQVANLDARVDEGFAVTPVQIKTSTEGEAWGKQGTTDIPRHVRTQVMFEMDTYGAAHAYVVVLLPFLEFRWYRIDYSVAEASAIREACEQFRADLAGNIRPPIDAAEITYTTLRKLHPDIDDEDVDLPDSLAREFCDSRRALKEAEARAQYATNLVSDHLGGARRARFDGQTLAYRMPGRGDKPPTLRAMRNLPIFDLPEETAA